MKEHSFRAVWTELVTGFFDVPAAGILEVLWKLFDSFILHYSGQLRHSVPCAEIPIV